MARKALLLALLGVLAIAPAARADGDPASDFLISQRIFLPYDTKIPKPDQQLLAGIVQDAAKKGYPIRVALIASDYDLGSVTILWKQPRPYAKFLAKELSFIRKQPILTVMPNGMGFYWVGHRPAGENELLAKVPIPAGSGGLARAATTAVQRLAAARGLKLVPAKVATAKPSHRNRNDRILIVALVAVLVAAAIAARLLVSRLRAGRPSA